MLPSVAAGSRGSGLGVVQRPSSERLTGGPVLGLAIRLAGWKCNPIVGRSLGDRAGDCALLLPLLSLGLRLPFFFPGSFAPGPVDSALGLLSGSGLAGRLAGKQGEGKGSQLSSGLSTGLLARSGQRGRRSSVRPPRLESSADSQRNASRAKHTRLSAPYSRLDARRQRVAQRRRRCFTL